MRDREVREAKLGPCIQLYKPDQGCGPEWDGSHQGGIRRRTKLDFQRSHSGCCMAGLSQGKMEQGSQEAREGDSDRVVAGRCEK